MNAALIRMAGVFLLACGVMAIWGGGDAAWPDSAWWLFPGLVAYMLGDFYGQLVLRRELSKREQKRVFDANADNIVVSAIMDRLRQVEELAKKVENLNAGVDCTFLSNMVVDLKTLVCGVNCATLLDHIAKTEKRVDAVEDAVSMDRFQSILVRLYGQRLIETFTGQPEKKAEPIMVNEVVRMLLAHFGLTIQRTAAETKLVPVSKPGKKVRRG